MRVSHFLHHCAAQHKHRFEVFLVQKPVCLKAPIDRRWIMAFSDYKNVSQIQQQFKIKYHEDNFVAPQEREPSDIFKQEFAFSLENIDVFTSEGARAEAVIFPVLREVYKGYHDQFSLWIQRPIAYDAALSGTP